MVDGTELVNAAHQLGKDLIENQSLTPALVEKLAQPLVSIEEYMEKFNAYMDQYLKK